MNKLILFATIFSFGFISGGDKKADILRLKNQPKSDVFLQGFYWNSPPGGIWYDSLSHIAARLASAGFGAVWIPPAAKGGGGMSMGYDIYDNYDFGEYYQKGSLETRFGSRSELENMVGAFHEVGIQLFYDAVLNHAGNGDDQSSYQCGTGTGYNVFNPQSGRFPKTAANFHPNNVHCDNNAPYHNNIFFEDLCYFSGGTGDSLKVWGDYIINQLGFDGFRIDAIKHIEPGFIASFTQHFPGKYIVGEHWSSTSEIIDYNNQVSSLGGNSSYFDFPLRYVLKDMCNTQSGNFNMNTLDGAGLINSGLSPFNVATFVENHDFDRVGWDGNVDNGHDPILFDKQMAYAYTIFSEGKPTVFFKDYFDYGYGGVIDTLIWIRQKFLGGGTTKRSGLNPYYIREDGNTDQNLLAADIYVARRDGWQDQPGGYLIINDNQTKWIDIWVDTEQPVGALYKDYSGKDVNKPVFPPASGGTKNRVKLWAPPRSFTLYVADTTQSINNEPVLEKIGDQKAYTNSKFFLQINAFDVNNDPLTYSVSGNPAWMQLNQTGALFGTPVFSDTGSSNIIISAADPFGATAVDTFNVDVRLNYPPSLSSINDTTVKATIRFETQAFAIDPDEDTLNFSLKNSPAWLTVGKLSGMISGTPAIEDTGSYQVKLFVTDGKNAYDSTSFHLNVVENIDSIIATYGKPFIDGNISIDQNDWLAAWQLTVDSDTDSYWHPATAMDNELLGLYVTWDSDSLYLGVDYILNDNFNSLMLYVDAGLPGGITNFNSTSGYAGDYAKNFRFRQFDNIDFFTAAYYLDDPSIFLIDGNASTNINDKVNSLRGANGRASETAIAWNDIYNLGAGLIPINVKLKFVGVVTGGFNYGGGDSSPNNPDINGDAGPDSLIYLVEVNPDQNSDGIPDPTIIISSSEKTEGNQIPNTFVLKQNYPNPFNPVTKIAFDVPASSQVELIVYDILGRKIETLVNNYFPAGNYTVIFEAIGLPSGIYFYSLQADKTFLVRKMVYLK